MAYLQHIGQSADWGSLDRREMDNNGKMRNVAVTFQNKVLGLVDHTKTELVRANSKYNQIFLLFYRQLILLC